MTTCVLQKLSQKLENVEDEVDRLRQEPVPAHAGDAGSVEVRKKKQITQVTMLQSIKPKNAQCFMQSHSTFLVTISIIL